MVGDEGIEPSTSVLSGQRSTTELVAQYSFTCYHNKSRKNQKNQEAIYKM